MASAATIPPVPPLASGWVALLADHEAARDPNRSATPAHAPAAAILTCSDARVPPSVIFDQEAGQLFVVRVAGNTATPGAVASLDYATAELAVPLVVVLGHTNCGAVRAACTGSTDEYLAPLMHQIRALVGDRVCHDAERLGEENVRATMAALIASNSPTGHGIRSGRVALRGAIYDVATDRVQTLSTPLPGLDNPPSTPTVRTTTTNPPTRVRKDPPMTATIPATDTITAARLRQLIDDDPDIRILDVRTGGEFETTHIPGSYNVPLDTLGEHARDLADVEHPVVLVCQSGGRATQAHEKLLGEGKEALHILDGGMNAWQSIGGDVIHGATERWAMERQVRLVAGSLVLAGVLASVVLPPAKWIAAGVASGLVYAAASNSCLMGELLAKLPYNQTDRCDIAGVINDLNQKAA